MTKHLVREDREVKPNAVERQIMKEYKIENLRNIGIIGHSDSGKNALSEDLLYYTKTTDR